MSQALACSRALVLAVMLFGLAAAARPVVGQKATPAGPKADTERAPVFAATLIGDDAAEEMFRGAAVAVEADGSVLVVGRTGSTRFPVTGNAIKKTVTGASDVFVARFDATLRTLLAATLIGGSGDEGDCDVAVGPQGDIYIAGSTTSKDFPPGAAMLDSGSDEARSRTFVARLSRDLSSVLSAAVLSRESAPRTGATRVVFDRPRQRVLVGGTTASAAFPVTAGAFQTRMGSDQGAKFVAVLDPGLTKLVAATLLGGKAREGGVNGLLVDSGGNVFVGSSTFSSDYPTTERAFTRTVRPGQVWGAVSKLNPDLTTLLVSTFVGDTGNDRSRPVIGEVVSGNDFQGLGVPAHRGRTLAPDDERPNAERVLMVSYRYWQRELAGAPDAIGKTIRLRGEPYTVVGVAPAWFNGMTPLLALEIWLPVTQVGSVKPAGLHDTVASPTGTGRVDRRGQRW